MSSIDVQLGTFFKKRRQALGLSLEQVCTHPDIDFGWATLRKCENGEQSWTVDRLLLMGRVLDIPVQIVLDEAEE